MFRCFKIQLFPWNSCWLTLHKLCCTSLCVRTNLIYDTLTQNKQSFSVHILGFIDRLCLLNGQIYLTFHKTRQLGRKWCLWVYIKKPTTSFFSWNSYKAQTWMKPLACLCVKTHIFLGSPGSSSSPCKVLWWNSSVLNVRYLIKVHKVGRRVDKKKEPI